MSFSRSNKKILDYIITDQLLGRGSYSKVYLGFNIHNDKCAIKIISSLGLNISTKDKLLDEAKILKSLNHKNIIKLYDIYEDLDEIYIIMEYCENNLQLILLKLSEEQAKYYIKQIVNALYYLQNKNIVHRDIKPANILLKNDIIKICDFGFARAISNGDFMMDTICGSPLYMAPEILFKTKYSSKSDLWSLGIIIYQMVYHKHPYNNPKSISDLIKKIEIQEIDYPKTVSEKCIEIMQEILNLSPNHRLSWKELNNHAWFDNIEEDKENIEDKEEEIFNIEDILIDNYLESNTIHKSDPIIIGRICQKNKLSNNYSFRNSMEKTFSFFAPLNIKK
jgi:serine/threonine protein kinase